MLSRRRRIASWSCSGARAVSVDDWPSGSRGHLGARRARLASWSFARASPKTLDGLRRELEFASGEPATVGAVAIFRSETAGTALVYTTRSGVITVDADTSEGTLSESSVA